jgi:hypothetical protein
MGTESSSSVLTTIYGIVLLIILLLPTFLLSRLTKIEYKDFHDQWEKDGRPHGMPFWFPQNTMSSLGLRSYPWFVGTWWLFKTPEWTKNHETATKYLRIYRIVSYMVFISFIGPCLLLIFLTSR